MSKESCQWMLIQIHNFQVRDLSERETQPSQSPTPPPHWNGLSFTTGYGEIVLYASFGVKNLVENI